MKETFPRRLLQGRPNIITDGKASLGCGCHVFVGTRLDTMENATAASSCTPRHALLIQAFMQTLASNPRPSETPLLDHVERLLLAAEAATVKRTP